MTEKVLTFNLTPPEQRHAPSQVTAQGWYPWGKKQPELFLEKRDGFWWQVMSSGGKAHEGGIYTVVNLPWSPCEVWLTAQVHGFSTARDGVLVSLGIGDQGQPATEQVAWVAGRYLNGEQTVHLSSSKGVVCQGGKVTLYLGSKADWPERVNLSRWSWGALKCLTASTSPPEPEITVQAQVLNVRGGPGTSYPVVAILRQGDVLPATGRNPESTWIQVDGVQEWVSAAHVGLNVPLGSLPVVSGPSQDPVFEEVRQALARFTALLDSIEVTLHEAAAEQARIKALTDRIEGAEQLGRSYGE